MGRHAPKLLDVRHRVAYGAKLLFKQRQQVELFGGLVTQRPAQAELCAYRSLGAFERDARPCLGRQARPVALSEALSALTTATTSSVAVEITHRSDPAQGDP